MYISAYGDELDPERFALIDGIKVCLKIQGIAVLTGIAQEKYTIDINCLGTGLVFEGMQDQDVVLIYKRKD